MKLCKYLFSYSLILFLTACVGSLYAQSADSIYSQNIKSIRFHNAGDQLSMPLINLNSGDQVELHFDDMDADVKYYYYTFQLCNNDWKPVNLSQFDYIKGFTQMRITNYRLSSISFTRYTHYQAIIPDRNCLPSRSGNFLLKVFLDGDTSKLAFTKRLLVLNNKSIITARIAQPFVPEYFRTHQKVQFSVNVNGLNSFSATQQVKVVVLQNYRWDNALVNITPSFMRGTTLEYNTEDKAVFPGGKEWRWLDLRDFHLQSDRVKSAEYHKNSTDIYVRPDVDRSGQRYVYYRDLNGMYSVETNQNINPYWQSDYAMVHFYFTPPNGVAYTDKDIYLFGQLTNYNFPDSLKMQFNPDKSQYETRLFLKQGYYNYTYITVDQHPPYTHSDLEGNYYETENVYTILVYYRDITGRADELIGAATINSRTDKPGISF
jgi:Type 9 secretion system plug protein 1st domain